MNHELSTKSRTSMPVYVLMLIAVNFAMVKPASVRAETGCGEQMARRGSNGHVKGHCPECCPDDYVRKPAPCVCGVACCCEDTYCPKPCLVLPSPAKCCCPDDYCPKPHPALCRPMSHAWYKCVPLAPSLWPPRATCTGETD